MVLRLCRFEDGYGFVVGDEVVDITDRVAAASGNAMIGDPLITALPTLAALTPGTLSGARRRRLGEVALLSPVERPTKILAAPNNYRAHAAEMMSDAAMSLGRSGGLLEAGLFLKATTSLVGPAQGIAKRFPERRTDHEVELVAVIGRVVSDVPRAEALAYVAGYSLGLDITLRGPEERSLRKSIDTYTVLGPWLVTADEISDIGAIEMSLSVNGEIRQSTSLSDLVFGVAEQIEYASRFYTLYPGDLIFTGTPAGVGPIQPGDVLRAEATMIGAMDVHVRAFEPPPRDEHGIAADSSRGRADRASRCV
jgi:2,4-didehydro-3-deoxy-L-rhamnonate hydrolase